MAWATDPTVQANNLTHPALSPSFVAGDAYQYIVQGDPNQPVYIVQNGSPLTLVGQTDGNGYYQTTGVEQAAWAGDYTQTWYVGNVPASPSLSFSVSLATVVVSNITPPALSLLTFWRATRTNTPYTERRISRSLLLKTESHSR